MLVRGIVSTVGTGAPVPNGTQGEMRLLSDNTLVTTLETTDGWFEYEQNGNPGPFKITWDYAARVKIQYSKVTGPSGPTDIGTLPNIFRTFINGVIQGVDNNLTVTAAGASMNISANTGGAVVQGIYYDRRTSGNLTVSAAHATLARIDTVVVEVVPPGAGEDIEGRSELKIIAGTAAASPVAPTLTQTSALYQYPIYDVAVGAAVTVIASDKLTDRRTYARTTIPSGGVGTTELADLSVTTAKLANNAVTSAKIVDGTIATGDIADDAITAAKIAAGAVGSSEIAADAVGNSELAINAVTGENLNDDIITGYMLDPDYTHTCLMPISEFVATGTLSSGTRTLVTLGVGPLAGVTYAIQVRAYVTIRNNGSTGTVILRTNINGGTQATHEYQNVGGVPRLCEIEQSAEVVGSGGSINVTASVIYNSGDSSDIRAGRISVIAIPHPIMIDY